MQSVAVGYHVYEITRDPLALGYVGLAQFAPMFALTLFAGEAADRFDRRRVLAISYGVQALTAVGLLFVALYAAGEIWMYYALLVVFGSARAFAGPAGSALLPRLVPLEMLPRAIAWSASIFQVATIGGPALGGAVLIVGIAQSYAACAVIFLIVVVLVSLIEVQLKVAPVEPGNAFQRLTAGISYVRNTPVVLGALSLDLFAVLLGGATALLPIYARDILHVGPEGLGLLRSAPAAGAAVVSLWLGFRPLDRNAGPLMFACVGIFGAATIVFGVSENFFVSLAALLVLGASDMISVYVRSALVQIVTPDHMRGRVSAVNLIFIGASNELGEFESGVMASLLGVVPSVVVGGLGTLGVVALWAWAFPDLRRVDKLSALSNG